MSRLGHLLLITLTSLGAASSLLPAASHAQQIYRSVGPDGKVTFSDQPPASGNATMKSKSGMDAPGTSESGLPYGLQQVVNKYPVTLYSAKECDPCIAARNLLVSRGIPFTEKTVDNNESIESLKNLSGAASLPFGTIGSQRLNGFSDVEWTQYLDAAGYPRKSQLPSSYRRPPASPLATAKAAPAPEQTEQTTERLAPRTRQAPAPAAPAADTVAPAGPTPTNPAGIVF